MALATALSGVLLVLACAPAALAQEPGSAEEQELGRLFTQTAKRGTLEPAKGKPRFTLKLRGVAPQVVWFDDRPGRQTGQIPVGGFVRSWAGFGFKAVAPNAALTLLDAANHEDTVVLKLGSPRYKRKTRTVRYPALVLDEATGNLSHLEPHRDGSVPRRFRAASLFIDDASARVIDGCVIQPYTQCRQADLSSASLANVDLTGAQLAAVDLSHANLSGANLFRAEVVGSDLSNADLSNANLSLADLSSSLLFFADLTGANLTGANLTDALFCFTTMPDGSTNNGDCGEL